MSRRKPPQRRQNRSTDDIALLPSSYMDVPDAPDALSPSLRSRWYRLWNSDLAGAWSPETDSHVLERLFSLYSLREEALEALKRDGLLITGSRGRQTDHPAGRRMGAWDSEIRQLEDRLGLSPKAQLQLGIQITQARKSLAELAAAAKPKR